MCKYLCMVAWKSCIMHHKKAKKNSNWLNSRRLCRSLGHITGPLMKTLSVKITRDEWILAHVRGCRWVRRHRSKWHREQKSGREVEEADSPCFTTVRDTTLDDMKNLLATRCYAVRKWGLQRESSRSHPLAWNQRCSGMDFLLKVIAGVVWPVKARRIPACHCEEIPGYACFRV